MTVAPWLTEDGVTLSAVAEAAAWTFSAALPIEDPKIPPVTSRYAASTVTGPAAGNVVVQVAVPVEIGQEDAGPKMDRSCQPKIWLPARKERS